ncbi:MAG: glycosyltransferase family 4 protein, partial [Campylobacter sp.]|nr:glycosyltransferase family 4 protein [Campylobacter sp.]
MKVLFVISTLGKGGAERVASVLASRFAKDHETYILKFDSKEPFYELDSRVKVRNLSQGVDDKGVIGNLKKRFDKIFDIRKVLKGGNFDIVISFLDTTNILTILANFGLNYKLIATEHNSYDLLDKKLFAFLRNLAYKKVDLLTVLSKSDLLYYSKFVKNCEVIYNPFFGNLTQNTDKENIILSVARLEKVKGFDTMLKALSKIDPKLLKEYKVLIAGD